jgi:hypothetical protein
VRAVELAGLARRLESLSQGQTLDGALATEVAAEATLAQLESTPRRVL